MQQITLYTVGTNQEGLTDLIVLSKLEPNDRAVLYGDGVFETILVLNYKAIFFDSHLKRLLISMRRLNIFCDIPISRFKQFLSEDILDAGEKNCILRVSATRGSSTHQVGLFESHKPNFIVEIKPLPENTFAEVTLITAAERRNEFSALCSIKTLNYLSNLSARQEALRLGAFDALMLNTAGWVAECTCANIFAIINKELITPSLESGILPGIIRGIVLNLASTAGLTETVRKISKDELLGAQEVFITNSLKGVLPVAKLDQKEFLGSKGVYTQKLIELYQKEIEREF